MRRIRFYFDFVSPYSYLAWTQLPGLAERHDCELEPVAVLLAAILDARGTLGPAEVPAKRAYVIKEVVRRAHGLGVPLAMPPAHPFNSLRALRLASLPMDAETRRALVDRLFAATWGGGPGITEVEPVAAITRDVGLGDGVLADAESPEGKGRVRRQTDEALAAGAFGVPTIVADGELFFGVDALPYVEQFLRGADPVSPEILERWARLPVGAARKVQGPTKQ